MSVLLSELSFSWHRKSLRADACTPLAPAALSVGYHSLERRVSSWQVASFKQFSDGMSHIYTLLTLTLLLAASPSPGRSSLAKIVANAPHSLKVKTSQLSSCCFSYSRLVFSTIDSYTQSNILQTQRNVFEKAHKLCSLPFIIQILHNSFQLCRKSQKCCIACEIPLLHATRCFG